MWSARLGLGEDIHQQLKRPTTLAVYARLAHLLKTCQAIMPAYYPLILLLARTGLRTGEALALQARDIDLANRVVTVRRTWGLRGAVGEGPL